MYVLTFIDDFSRYGWVFFLKLKYEVYEIFKAFKYYVENFIWKKIKVLRTYNGKNMSIRTYSSSVKRMELKGNIQCLTHHNKMECHL